MIVKDEEKNIEKCLNSVKDLFDEIIIVDTGSTDNTKKISKKYTKKIYDFKWINDFSAARNYAFAQATKNYIMWLDADDIVKKEELLKLIELKKNLSSEVDIVMLKYDIAFDSDGASTFSYYRERILKNNKKFLWQDKVHEYIPLTGKIIQEDISITHDKKYEGISHRNLNIYTKMEKDNENFTPRNLYYYGRELFEHKKYTKAIKILKRFLNTEQGWIEDNINSCYLISQAYIYLNNDNEAVIWLYKTFNYDIPRKKTCCLIGNYFLNNNLVNLAIYWYGKTLDLPIKNTAGFYESDYDYFIPYLNLCLCYYKIGNINKSKYYHNLSKKIKPKNHLVLSNEDFFNKNKIID